MDLSTVVLAPEQLKAGIHLLEPFKEGLCGGLLVVLATGAVLRKYTYIDKDKKAVAVATDFVAKLAMRHPTHFSQEAIQGFINCVLKIWRR